MTFSLFVNVAPFRALLHRRVAPGPMPLPDHDKGAPGLSHLGAGDITNLSIPGITPEIRRFSQQTHTNPIHALPYPAPPFSPSVNPGDLISTFKFLISVLQIITQQTRTIIS